MSSCSSSTNVRIRSRAALWSRTRKGPRIAERSRASCPVPTSNGASVTGCVIRCLVSGGEGTAAAAAPGCVGILEGEAGSLHRRGVIDDDATDVLRRKRIHEHLELALLDDDVVLSGLILDQEPVLEAAAAA